MVGIRDSIHTAGLAAIVYIAAASVPVQAHAEEGLDCSAKTYYALRKQTTVAGSTSVEQLFNIVDRNAQKDAVSGETTGTYMGPKGTKEGQYRAVRVMDDYGDKHTLSFEIEFQQGEYLASEIVNVQVQYDIKQAPPIKGRVEPHYEFFLRDFISYDSKRREMYPSLKQEIEAELPKEDKALAVIFAESYAGNIVNSYFIDTKKYLPLCNLQRRTDLKAHRDAAGVAQDKIDEALGVKKEEESKGKKDEPKTGKKK